MGNNDASALCSLILTQMVYELGENDYVRIAGEMKNHPLLQNDPSVPKNGEVWLRIFKKKKIKENLALINVYYSVVKNYMINY